MNELFKLWLTSKVVESIAQLLVLFVFSLFCFVNNVTMDDLNRVTLHSGYWYDACTSNIEVCDKQSLRDLWLFVVVCF